jgi:hypothetical protein
MANEKEVKAQVRLRFWNVNRQRMTATRNLQVSAKKAGGLTMKTLEGILAKSDPDGAEGKVCSVEFFNGRGTLYRQNAQRWTRRCHYC